MPTFLFSDIENSTRLWEKYPAAMGQVLAHHDAILQEAIARCGGRIIKHTGDGVFAVFEGGAPLQCALEALGGMASILALEGALQQAVELAAVVLQHPASDKEARDKAERILARAGEHLPPEVFGAARARGQGWVLEEVVREVTSEERKVTNEE